MQNNSPVLFLIFNRPQTTAKVFEAIKKARPSQLFVAADGPRTGRNEDDLCKQTRDIATHVDWPCEVHTLFRENNLGCGKAVSEAITWFFNHVEQGIILEDDCLPDASFFTFCDELLDEYANTPEVMAISGTNLLPTGWKKDKQSYFFGHGGIWGWATWKRAWTLYDYDMTQWGDETNRQKVKSAINNSNWYYYYLNMFNDAYTKKLNTWDIQWFYCILNNNGVAINPSVNLVKNIGFGPGATNTIDTDGPYTKLKLNEMNFPLIAPAKIEMDKKYLNAIYKFIVAHGKSFFQFKKALLRVYLVSLGILKH